MLAVMSGATVVPAYVSGSGRALPRGRLVPRPAKVVVRFGPALSFAVAPDDARRERYREAAEEMMRAVARLRDEALRAPGAAATPAHMQERISG
jgi:1-acyl-sn-glycerol-3-phosphate acyltransferase